MEISSAHHQQMMSSHQLEEVLGGCPKAQQQQQQEKKPRPHPEQALRCPRCDSSNTKFCYYNNYSLTQPRYFCKGCRRYWTQGGSLRNVPVGGGCRKNKRSSSSSSKRQQQEHQPLITSTTAVNSLFPPLPPLSYDPIDLTLAFASLQKQPNTGMDDPFLLGNHNPNPNPNPNAIATHIPNAHAGSGFLDILRYGFLDSITTTTTTSVTNPSAFHNFYGFGGSSSVEEMDDGACGNEMMLPFDGSLSGGMSAPASAAASHGSPCRGLDGGEEKVMMGMQWQMSGDGGMGVESGRDYWNGVGSSWQHGLINSSLM